MLNFEFGYPSVAPIRRYFWQAIGAAVGSIGNAISNNHANKYNSRLMREQMAWQTGEREAQQSYQTSEREAQNAYSEQMYNNYASPSAMARQYAEAGLNPRLAMDSGSVGSPTSGSGSNGGAPSGQGAPAPAYIPQNNLASGFSDIAQALASLGQAKKAGVETSLLEAQFNDLVAKTKYEAETQKFIALFEKPLDVMLKKKGVQRLLVEIANGQLQGEEIKERIHSLKLDNDIKQNELDHWLETWQAELNKTKAETANTEADTNVKNEMPEYIRSNTRLNGIKYYEVKASIENLFTHADLNRALSRLTGLQGDQLEEFKPYLLDEIISRVENMDANTQLTFGRELNQSLRNTNLQMLGTEEYDPKTFYGQFSYDAQGQVRSTLGHSITTAARNFHEDKPEYHHKPRAHDKDTHSPAKAVPHKKYDKKP